MNNRKIKIGIIVGLFVIVAIILLFVFKSCSKEYTIITKKLSYENSVTIKQFPRYSEVYMNDELIGYVSYDETKEKITEVFYHGKKMEDESIIYKIVYYLDDDGKIVYSEKYSNKNIVLSKTYFTDNKISRIIHENSFAMYEYKEENDSLYSYKYLNEILFSKCEYDREYFKKEKCEYYDKSGNITKTYEATYGEYGELTNYTYEYKTDDKDNEKHSFSYGKGIIYDKYNDYKDEYVFSNLISLGSRVLVNTPYIYNQIETNILYNANVSSYSLYDYLDREKARIYLDNNEEYAEIITIYEYDDYDNHIETHGLFLNETVKFKDIDYFSYVDGNNQSLIDVHEYFDYSYLDGDYMDYYINYKNEYIKDKKVKAEIMSKWESGTEYYDWYSGEAITEEEYEEQLKELVE